MKLKDLMKFLPLLFFYIVIVLVFSRYDFQGDEGRYVLFAKNLLRGFFASHDNLDISNGPGYPLIVVPFAAWGKAGAESFVLKFPWLCVKLLNAFFLFFAVFYFFNTLKLYLKEKNALIFSFLFGIYPPFLVFIHFMMTETFAVFLVSGYLFHFAKLHNDKKPRFHLIISSFYLGYLALTKVFFGYVIMAGILIYFALYILRKRDAVIRSMLVYLFALVFCLPYLFYTYSLTGKVFYWGVYGGEGLYSMTTPYENELGDWLQVTQKRWREKNPEAVKNHGETINKLEGLTSWVEIDSELKQLAIENIKKHPFKYMKNWAANVGRLLFNYPYSSTPQKLSTYYYMIPNMFLIVFLFISLYPAYIGRKLIPFEIFHLALFGITAFALSTFVSVYVRQFTLLVPFFALWVVYTLTQILIVDIRR